MSHLEHSTWSFGLCWREMSRLCQAQACSLAAETLTAKTLMIRTIEGLKNLRHGHRHQERENVSAKTMERKRTTRMAELRGQSRKTSSKSAITASVPSTLVSPFEFAVAQSAGAPTATTRSTLLASILSEGSACGACGFKMKLMSFVLALV